MSAVTPALEAPPILPYGADLLNDGTAADSDPMACIHNTPTGPIDDSVVVPPPREAGTDYDIQTTDHTTNPDLREPFGAESLQRVSERAALGVLACINGLSTNGIDDRKQSVAENLPYTNEEVARLN